MPSKDGQQRTYTQFRWQGLTNSDRSVPESRDKPFIEAAAPFQCPCFICVVQEILSIVGNRFAILVDHDGRIVVFGAGGPFRGHVDPLGIADSDDAVVLERDGPSPERRDARAGGF